MVKKSRRRPLPRLDDNSNNGNDGSPQISSQRSSQEGVFASGRPSNQTRSSGGNTANASSTNFPSTGPSTTTELPNIRGSFGSMNQQQQINSTTSATAPQPPTPTITTTSYVSTAPTTPHLELFTRLRRVLASLPNSEDESPASTPGASVASKHLASAALIAAENQRQLQQQLLLHSPLQGFDRYNHHHHHHHYHHRHKQHLQQQQSQQTQQQQQTSQQQQQHAFQSSSSEESQRRHRRESGGGGGIAVSEKNASYMPSPGDLTFAASKSPPLTTTTSSTISQQSFQSSFSTPPTPPSSFPLPSNGSLLSSASSGATATNSARRETANNNSNSNNNAATSSSPSQQQQIPPVAPGSFLVLTPASIRLGSRDSSSPASAGSSSQGGRQSLLVRNGGPESQCTSRETSPLTRGYGESVTKDKDETAMLTIMQEATMAAKMGRALLAAASSNSNNSNSNNSGHPSPPQSKHSAKPPSGLRRLRVPSVEDDGTKLRELVNAMLGAKRRHSNAQPPPATNNASAPCEEVSKLNLPPPYNSISSKDFRHRSGDSDEHDAEFQSSMARSLGGGGGVKKSPESKSSQKNVISQGSDDGVVIRTIELSSPSASPSLSSASEEEGEEEIENEPNFDENNGTALLMMSTNSTIRAMRTMKKKSNAIGEREPSKSTNGKGGGVKENDDAVASGKLVMSSSSSLSEDEADDEDDGCGGGDAKEAERRRCSSAPSKIAMVARQSSSPSKNVPRSTEAKTPANITGMNNTPKPSSSSSTPQTSTSSPSSPSILQQFRAVGEIPSWAKLRQWPFGEEPSWISDDNKVFFPSWKPGSIVSGECETIGDAYPDLDVVVPCFDVEKQVAMNIANSSTDVGGRNRILIREGSGNMADKREDTPSRMMLLQGTKTELAFSSKNSDKEREQVVRARKYVYPRRPVIPTVQNTIWPPPWHLQWNSSAEAMRPTREAVLRECILIDERRFMQRQAGLAPRADWGDYDIPSVIFRSVQYTCQQQQQQQQQQSQMEANNNNSNNNNGATRPNSARAAAAPSPTVSSSTAVTTAFVVYDYYLASTEEERPSNTGNEPHGTSTWVRPFYVPTGPEDDTLVFESRFESGNLRRAIRVGRWEYDLILQQDTNTNGRTQWFYFSTANMRTNKTYRFNIINMEKSESLYTSGMRIMMYSEKEALQTGVGWRRVGDDIAYFPNRHESKSRFFCTLSFSLQFSTADDRVYIAHHYPYTFTQHLRHLDEIFSHPTRSKHAVRTALCKTLAGNTCEVITITAGCEETLSTCESSNIDDPDWFYEQQLKKRKGIFLCARVHPGEPGASWIMKGVLDFLTGDSVQARTLRLQFVFICVPMLNIDGVVVGNYRCSLGGSDLNRQWQNPNPMLHPTIFHTKMLLRRFSRERELFMFCDMHSHSNKPNVFIYGVGTKKKSASNKLCRLFPKILSEGSDMFRYESGSFKVKKNKEATARVVVARELGVSCSYTLEASFGGANFGPLQNTHFNCSHLENIGVRFCEGLLRLSEILWFSHQQQQSAMGGQNSSRRSSSSYFGGGSAAAGGRENDTPLRGGWANAMTSTVWTAAQPHELWIKGK